MTAAIDANAVLTHHWLVARRGGEHVLAALRELLPAAPIYTLVHDPRSAGDGWGDVHTSFLQHLPGARRHYPKYLPLHPLAARRVRLPDVDLVVCSDAALAKAMRPAPRSRVVCYCHSPMRYVWEPAISRVYAARELPALLRPMWGPLCAYLRRCDQAAAARVDRFVANSHAVAERIRRAYARECRVIYPPVALPPAPASHPRESHFLCVGRHVPYKRLDLAVEACAALRRPLVVIGDGPDLSRLRTLHAGATIRFLGYQPDHVVREHYRTARALLFPGEEDFGIVPVEAMAHGCPVIAYGAGGATESVVDGSTGVLFAEQSVECLASAIERFDRCSFDSAAMHAAMQRFSRERFLAEMRDELIQALQESR